MKWDIPSIPKIYEALGTIGDERIEIDGNTAKVYSSSRNKFYTVTYDAEQNAIMCNDNSSFYVGMLGYPSITYLLLIGELDLDRNYATALAGIPWKDMNQKNKNDFEKTCSQVDVMLEKEGVDIAAMHTYMEKVLQQIIAKDLNHLGKKQVPPKGY